MPPEFKYTGDYALTETYAFLFNHLVSDCNWLRDFLGLADPTEFVRSVMLARLVTVRRYVAKLTFEGAPAERLGEADEEAVSGARVTIRPRRRMAVGEHHRDGQYRSGGA